MGNRMTCGVGRRAVEERLTRPQRLVRQSSDVDYRKLRKLILSHKLAPCFDADDDPGFDLEECPICFLYYPSLNRSRCCAKGICTECFLQMKPSDATRPAQCPFCKTPCYAVEYRGARTEEEKGLEIAEEQKVIEAKIRMQHESENVGCVMPVDNTQSLEIRSISNLRGQSIGPGDGRDSVGTATSLMGESFEADGFSPPNICNTRNEEYALDLEEVMLMEAICQSLQDVRVQRRRMDRTCGSSNVVGTESGILGSNNNGTLSVSSCQEEYSTDSLAEQYSTDSLAEHSILNLQISGPIYRRSQTDHEPCVDYSSDGVGTETDCFARLSDSGEHNVSEHTDLRCCSLINMPSTSNASVGCFLGSNDDTGPSCYHISGLIDAEQPFIFVTESKA